MLPGGPACETPCSAAALESSAGAVGVVTPGRIELFKGHGVVKDVADPAAGPGHRFLAGGRQPRRPLVPGPVAVGLVSGGGQPQRPAHVPSGPAGVRPRRPARSAGLLGRQAVHPRPGPARPTDAVGDQPHHRVDGAGARGGPGTRPRASPKKPASRVPKSSWTARGSYSTTRKACSPWSYLPTAATLR